MKKIGSGAFYNCASLSAINVDSGNTEYSSVDGILFSKDKTELLAYPAGKGGTSYSIPNTVTTIGNVAFNYCKSLTSVTIPNSVTSIGGYAFYNTAYYNNESNWENGVLYIGNHLIEAKGTVSGSYKIKSGTITVADSAFSGCTTLTNVKIPDSVTSIGYDAFSDCTSLASVKIPAEVKKIESVAFRNCASLASITIPNSVTSIGGYAFENCTSLASITIPDSVTSIGYRAFYGTAMLVVYYSGTQEQWKKISIKSDNSKLTGATIHYGSSVSVASYKAAKASAAAFSLRDSSNTVYTASALNVVPPEVCMG